VPNWRYQLGNPRIQIRKYQLSGYENDDGVLADRAARNQVADQSAPRHPSVNLLSRFELSWWRDVLPMLDSKNYLPVAGVKRLLGMLQDREAGFQTSLTVLPPENRQYFQERSQELQRFLQQAIDLNEPIYCSL
jgi:hypothetical protein